MAQITQQRIRQQTRARQRLQALVQASAQVFPEGTPADVLARRHGASLGLQVTRPFVPDGLVYEIPNGHQAIVHEDFIIGTDATLVLGDGASLVVLI